MQPHYLTKIFKVSSKYLEKCFTPDELVDFKDICYKTIPNTDRHRVVQSFNHLYYETIRARFQSQHPYNVELDKFLAEPESNLKILWGDCLRYLRNMKSESVQLMITSPPYYNARDYSQWDSLDGFLEDMDFIIQECYRVLDNHRVFVFNVGDIFDNDRKYTRSNWGKRRIPLGAYFTVMFEKAGFTFVDDFIWDKGEVQSQRHKNGDSPYPLYQYPINCYEHIFVFQKHRLDNTMYPCPICGCLKVNGNAYSGVGIKSWECKNFECMERSAGNRGKRFSARTKIMNELKSSENLVNNELLKQWRRDIVSFPPVIKINSSGKNVLGHDAPFPRQIPYYSTKVFSGVGEVVLDPFAGSFTTPIEATELKRVGIGIELHRNPNRDILINKLGVTSDIFHTEFSELEKVHE
ncbi:MAG: site-specific DNA-methyltransferase [Gammaproteobacteria bacterium]|nr:site-specific DNA-methyltransferase [Gammaproteobacteria bacterium]MYK43594.1 site-specific DNA-methyltransferase [Gammaproteobacteria bacterium]